MHGVLSLGVNVFEPEENWPMEILSVGAETESLIILILAPAVNDRLINM